MFCEKCGRPIKDGEKFCTGCGARINADDTNTVEIKAGDNPPAEEPKIKIKKNSWIWKLGIAIVLVAAIIAAIIFGHNYSEAKREEKYRDAIEQAEKYLNDLDYENAIASYEEAIKLNPKEPEPYIGLADAYIGLGDYESARDALEEGLDQTDDEDIEEYLDRVLEALETEVELNGMVSEYNPDNSNGIGIPVEGAVVSISRVAGTSYSDDTETDSDGWYSFDDLYPGQYELTIEMDGFITSSGIIEVYPGQEEMYNSLVPLISNDYSGKGTASGVIIDAVTGEGVKDLTIMIREGTGLQRGKVVDTITTDSDGKYTTKELDAGYYSAEIIDERGKKESYLRSSMNIYILGGRDTFNQNGSVSTTLSDGQLRIVLTWNEYPYDLDSHLFCDWDGGERHHNYYGNRYYYDGNETIVDLDLDDTTSYGPETTTIYADWDGEYTFGVVDFDHYGYSGDYDYGYNGGYDVSESLSASGAMVQVYMDNSSRPSYVFYVPQGEGYYWEVFRYNSSDRKLTPVNTLSYTYDESGYPSEYTGVYDENRNDYYYDDYPYYEDPYYDDGYDYGYDDGYDYGYGLYSDWVYETPIDQSLAEDMVQDYFYNLYGSEGEVAIFSNETERDGDYYVITPRLQRYDADMYSGANEWLDTVWLDMYTGYMYSENGYWDYFW